jgi:hypothetical protein
MLPARLVAWFAIGCFIFLGFNGPAPAAGAAGPQGTGPMVSTGLATAIAASADGRYILGMSEKGKALVWDVTRNRTARNLHSGPRYRYLDISASGTVISYTKLMKFNSCVADVPKVRNRVTNKSRVVATAANGRLLKAWRPPHCPGDEDDSRLSYAPQFSAPALSDDGRYVAFCANLTAPQARTLYRKDLKTGALQSWPDICATWEDGGDTGFVAPQVSGNGQVILVPGAPDWTDGAADTSTFQLVVSGQVLPAVAGGAKHLNGAGTAVLAYRPGTGCGYPTCAPIQVRYDVATATATTLAAGSPIAGSISADGTYAMFAPYNLPLAVANLVTGVTTDLVPAVAAYGLAPATDGPDFTPWYSWAPILTPDGTRVIFRASTGFVQSFRWVG